MSAAPEFLLQCAVGLDRLLWREVHDRDGDARRLATHVLAERNSLLLVTDADIDQLLRCRIADDIFVVLARGSVHSGAEGLADLERLASHLTHLDVALADHAARNGGRGDPAARTYRLVVRAAGDRAYRRIDVERQLTPIVGGALGRHWRPVDDAAHLEIWVTLLASDAIIALRITGAEQRHRGKSAHMPGSLRPSVAAALVRLSSPRDDDRVLDPFCGAGTILIERDLAGRHGMMVGSDISTAALDAARENMGPRHQPRELHRWDATSLPLERGSIDAIITNPPFGIKVEATNLAALQRRFVSEAHRVIGPGGRLVTLAARPDEITRLLREPEWVAVRRHDFETQGRRVSALVAIRV